MPSNLASTINIGKHSACLVRLARLDTDCSPLQGTDSVFVTAGLVTLTGTPLVEEGTQVEPKTACGDYAFRVEKPDRIKRYDLSGEFIFFDHELMFSMFGGTSVVGRAATPFATKVVGHAMPDPATALSGNGMYLEVIQLTALQGVGDCNPSASSPYAYGTIFPRVKFVPGDSSFTEDAATLTFTGKATANPNMFDGPWNDWPGTGYMPNSPKIDVLYSKTQYDAMAVLARAGWQNAPTSS